MRKALLALAALLAVLLPAAPAWAHTALVTADPAKDSTLPTSPATVTLTFSQRLNPDFTTIAISDTARQRVPTGAPAVDGTKGTVVLDRTLGNGTYTVAYRVVSADGHTVQGAYTFTVADPAAPPSAAAAATTVERKSTPTVALIAGVAVLGLLLYAVTRRRRTSRETG